LETATENESRFFRKRIVYGEKGVRPIAVYVGTHVESHRPEEYLLVAWHDTYRTYSGAILNHQAAAVERNKAMA